MYNFGFFFFWKFNSEQKNVDTTIELTLNDNITAGHVIITKNKKNIALHLSFTLVIEIFCIGSNMSIVR